MKHSTAAKLHIRIVSILLALVLAAGVLPVQATVSGAAAEISFQYSAIAWSGSLK